jgi:RNA recognition motif-containing protein
MYDPHTRESRGFGFIQMQNTEDANRAMEAVNATDIDGRIVTVEKVIVGNHSNKNYSVPTNSVPSIGETIKTKNPYSWALPWSS